jgi:hypothetical protein
MDISFRHMKAILTAFPFFVAVLLSGCGSGCGTLGVANTSPCVNGTSSDTSTTATTSTFNISGTVSGAARGGVAINLTGAGTANTTTDANGTYTFTALPTGSYTVVPSLQGSAFNPASDVVTINGANVTVRQFVETSIAAGTFSISGTVGGVVKQNVLITLSVGNSGSALTDANGGYSFSGLAAGIGPVTVTPTLAGHTFNPVSTSVTQTSSGINNTINFTATL